MPFLDISDPETHYLQCLQHGPTPTFGALRAKPSLWCSYPPQLKAVPSVNGRILFGRYIPFSTVDVSCLVNIDDGKDLAMCRVTNADTTSIEGIGEILRSQADKLRKGKPKCPENTDQSAENLANRIT